MLSHRDADHVGGAASVLAGMPVSGWASSLADDHPLRARSTPHQRCMAGQQWTWDGVHFEVLHPTAADYTLGLKPNALSCVLRVRGAGSSALLTGDIEAPQEAALVQRAADSLRSDVLLVPHHGSRTSSSAEFLAAVRPSIAVAPVGYRNRFGHPNAEVMGRYASMNVRIFRTDRDGAITVNLSEEGLGIMGARQQHRRYWHDSPT